MKKKMTNDEKIITALDAMDASIRKLHKFAAKYDDHIDKAALRGDDARAKALIKRKVGVYNLADQLEMLKDNFELGAYTSHVAADLGKLPAALDGCQGLLSESPNFKKVGNSLQKIFQDMQKPVDEISRLNRILDDILSPGLPTTLESRLDASAAEETDDRFNAEYAAMMERIKSKVAPERVAKPEQAVDDTGVIDFDGIIDAENKKQ